MAHYTLPEATGVPASMVASSVVGFFRIRDERGEIMSPVSAGSGSLVRMPGDLLGVLTAAHVLDEIPNTGLFGLLTFTRHDSWQQAKVDAVLTRKIYAPGWTADATMPDLGFLHILDPEIIAAVRARGCSFYDLERERRIGLTEDGGLAGEVYGAGVVAESKMVVDGADGVPTRTGYTSMIALCKDVLPREIGDFHIISANLEVERAPVSYGGVSGGGLWLISSPDASDERLERFFAGVLFYQSDAGADGHRTLQAHSLVDVEKHLVFQFRATPAGGTAGNVVTDSKPFAIDS